MVCLKLINGKKKKDKSYEGAHSVLVIDRYAIKYSTLCTEKDNLGCLRHLIVSVRDAEHLNTS